MTCIHLPLSLSCCLIDNCCGFCPEWLVLAVCGSVLFAYAVLFLLQSTPNHCFTPCHSPSLLSFSSMLTVYSPFNPIFTDLEVAFHQLWMLKETNLLPDLGLSAAGLRKAVRLQEWLIEACSFAQSHWVAVYTHGSVHQAQATQSPAWHAPYRL